MVLQLRFKVKNHCKTKMQMIKYKMLHNSEKMLHNSEPMPAHKNSSGVSFLYFNFLKIEGVIPVTFLNWADK